MWTSGSTTASPLIGLSAGEPAGIGPDLCVRLAQQAPAARIVIAADAAMLDARTRLLGEAPRFVVFDPDRPDDLEPGQVGVWHHPAAAPVVPGHLDPANSRYVLQCLDSLTDACQQGRMDALVTGPVQKSVIADAGIPFSGHTEYLAERLHTKRVVMMLVGGGLRVALATTHLPLSAVPGAITRESLGEILDIIDHDLRQRFHIPSPKILVTGLNPHAGEGGHLGREEIDVIAPALLAARHRGIEAVGPLPADTLFVPQHLEGADCVLAMYHDQGLPVLKMKSFGEGVNVTLGLPIIRTSVDHGTALDLAGTGRADLGSLHAAIALALQMIGP
jgi:4-hydroxythreonine-4-phosphate dehydrogenase